MAGRGTQSGDAQADDRERELAVDAQWKLIQKNCFTRWTNERLKAVNKQVGDLATDLSDGLRLIALIEVLSGKVFAQKYTRRPTLRPQKLENVTMALRFLERDEGIRIVNIGECTWCHCPAWSAGGIQVQGSPHCPRAKAVGKIGLFCE